MSADSPAGPGGPGIPRRGASEEEVGKLKQRVSDIERQLNREEPSEEKDLEEEGEDDESGINTLEEVYYAVVLAGCGVGVVGIAGSLLVSAWGFATLFLIGTAFLSYAYHHGYPDEIKI